MRIPTRAAVAALALAAAGLPAGVAQAGAPYGVHVAYGADPETTATIAWFTPTLNDPGSVVQYGTTPSLGSFAEGSASKVYGVDVLVHEVLLTGLTPGADVYYSAGGSTGTTPVKKFRTAPAGSDFRFTVFGDHGVKEQSEKTMLATAARNPDFHLIPGDISYAQSGDGSFADLSQWEKWFRMMEPFASTVPVMVAPGNHETEAAGNTASYRTRFAMPGAEEYYSFDVGRVHFLILQSDVTGTTRTGVQAAQAAFARADLADAALRRSQGDLDFLVVVQHHPIYGTQSASVEGAYTGRQVNPFQVTLLEPLLVQFDVDLVIAAHNHYFERSHRMIARQVTGSPADGDAPGYVQLITGGGGQSLYSFDPNGAAWSAARASRYHYTEIEATEGELNIRVVSTDGSPGDVLDSFTLRAG